MTNEGHKYGKDCIGAFRRDFWEKDPKLDGKPSERPFLPRCPHCKKEMEQMVTLPVVVTYTNMPRSYMICCSHCQTVIHTIDGTKDTYDSWLKEKENVREKEERDDELEHTKLLVNLDSVQLDGEFVEDVFSIMSREQLELANKKIKSKLSGSDLEKYQESSLNHYLKDE